MKHEAAEAYPLAWPRGRSRTTSPDRSRFDRGVTTARARDELVGELERLGASQVVISTNMPLRKDGAFYASAKEPDDRGVAVYFLYKGRQKCFSCDKWDRLKDNLWAIRKTIESLRGIERWGTGEMVEAAFAGFDALPAPGQASDPYSILGVSPDSNFEEIWKAWRQRIQETHPDHGGSQEEVLRVNGAYMQIKEMRGVS